MTEIESRTSPCDQRSIADRRIAPVAPAIRDPCEASADARELKPVEVDCDVAGVDANSILPADPGDASGKIIIARCADHEQGAVGPGVFVASMAIPVEAI